MLTWLSPFLLWGTLLGAIPLIIHLLNRRRFQRVEWAPMRYLKLTIQKNRRRIQIEQWLLLLLRILLPVILFLFLARPILKPTGLEQWFGGGGRTSQVVVVDDSLSMGYAANGPPALHRAREIAASLLASARPQDRCTLVATSDPAAPVFQEVEGSNGERLASDALALMQTETHASWPLIFEGLERVLASCTYPTRQITLITDLRRAGWDSGVGEIARQWSERGGTALRVIDVGSDESANLQLESLSPLDRTVLAGADSRWEAVVRNNSPRTISDARAVLRVDDRPTEIRLPDIEPRQAVRVLLKSRFPGAGPHALSFQLPEDELPGDNQRWAAVPVKDSLLIRLVDGEPSSEPFGSEVDYVAAPLSIGVGDADAWRVETVLADDFLSQKLEPPDVLVMANVEAPTPEQAHRLSELVHDGMGLILFTGARVDDGLYNQLLFQTEPRVLPMALKGLVDAPIHGLYVEPVRPSPIEPLLELKPSALERVSVRQIMGVEEDSATDDAAVRVLARWNDEKSSPAIIERELGDGRALLWTTTADRAGSDWPVEPSFVLAIREAVRGTARPTSLANNVTAGESIRRVIHADQQVGGAQLVPPGGGEPRPLAAIPLDHDAKEVREGGPAVALTLPPLRQAGTYRLTWEAGPLGTQHDLFAANPDPRESDLTRLSSAELQSLLLPLRAEVSAARSEAGGSFAPTGREMWHPIAWTLLVLLVLESIFATWVGRSR